MLFRSAVLRKSGPVPEPGVSRQTMKRFLATFLLCIISACAQMRPLSSLSTSAIQLTVFCTTGSDAPLVSAFKVLKPDVLLVQTRAHRSYHIHLTPNEMKSISESYSSSTFASTFQAQQNLGPHYGCCDKAEVLISFEQPPSLTAILHPVSFPLDEGLPPPVSQLLERANDALAARGYSPIIDKWEIR